MIQQLRAPAFDAKCEAEIHDLISQIQHVIALDTLLIKLYRHSPIKIFDDVREEDGDKVLRMC